MIIKCCDICEAHIDDRNTLEMSNDKIIKLTKPGSFMYNIYSSIKDDMPDELHLCKYCFIAEVSKLNNDLPKPDDLSVF